MENAERFIGFLKSLREDEQVGLLTMLEGLNALLSKQKSGRRAANRSSAEFRSRTFQENP